MILASKFKSQNILSKLNKSGYQNFKIVISERKTVSLQPKQ